MSCSRPINDVDVTGRERELPVGVDAGDAGSSPRTRGREPLAQEQGEVVADQPPELLRARRTIGTRVGPHRSISSIMAVSRGSRSGAGVLMYSSRGIEWRESELVLETRDVHARPDPAVPLPIQADEDVGLG